VFLYSSALFTLLCNVEELCGTIYSLSGVNFFSFGSFQKESGLSYSDMLFFDDEYRNIRDLTAVGEFP